MTEATTINEAYAELTNEHHRWTLTVFASIYTAFAICGIPLNFFVVYVTIRTKNLDSSANKLLALLSFFEMISQFGHFLFAYSVISGHYLMPYKLVIRLLTPSYFAFCCASLLLLFTAIDRLIYVLFPLRETKNVLIYSLVLPIFGLINVLCMHTKICDVAGETLVTGSMNDIGMATYQCSNNLTDSIWQTLMNMIYLSTIVIYLLVAILIFFRKAPPNSNSNQVNIRIFRALFFIISVNVGGYYLKFIHITMIIPLLNNDIIEIWNQNQIFGILLNISCISNAPILFWTSSEYRQAFVKEWQKIRNKIRNVLFSTNSVQTF